MEKQQGGKLTVSSAQRDAMGGTKNKRDDDDEDEDGEAANESLHQPKQKKLKTSAEDDDEGALPSDCHKTLINIFISS